MRTHSSRHPSPATHSGPRIRARDSSYRPSDFGFWLWDPGLRGVLRSPLQSVSWLLLLGSLSLCLGCRTTPSPTAEKVAIPSLVAVRVNPGVPVLIKTSTAEFEVQATGYVRASLLKDGKPLSLDEPQADSAASADYVLSGGEKIGHFTLDFDHVRIAEARGKLGARGKRVEIVGTSPAGHGADIEQALALEVYDDFPDLLLTAVTYKNVGPTELSLERVVTNRRRLNASRADSRVAPYDFWSFQGSSYEWGKPDVLEIPRGFNQPNLMGAPTPKGLGGGIPVVDFWTATLGEAIGHLEARPKVVSFPVRVGEDGRINVSMELEPGITLKPGEEYSTPTRFVAVHSGNYYEALRMWSSALQRERWIPARPTDADYQVSWCGWGYEQDFTPAQMMGTIPKLKELGIKWATLDYRWFDDYGDWEPRPDTFPGETIKKVVDAIHRQGILVQLWWQPIAVEDGQGKHALPKPMVSAQLIKQHPEWLILDKQGKHARLISPVSTGAALCPALPEVQEYYRTLVERFVREWGFDGFKMDSVYSVPPCYNPQHHHRSPDESIESMAKVYEVILHTLRSLKPESVTQICPCGTTPNYAWLPFEDQAVTADPVGGVQVRRRIKMYKALLGPNAAVYGDHVELSAMRQVGQEWIESGRDFASTVGTGGVVGTKFTWPGNSSQPQFRRVQLTPEKEAHWKKWITICSSRMLSRGTFLNLYTIGYELSEGYAIEKDNKMYYAFFLPDESRAWRGKIELRGLRPGKYRVFDYVNGRDLGTVAAPNPSLEVEFRANLLLEVSGL